MCKYLSIDIGGTNIKFGLFDKSGNLITKDYTSTPNNISDFVKTIDKIVKKYLVNIKELPSVSQVKLILKLELYITGARYTILINLILNTY